jgi:hypothetical protein
MTRPGVAIALSVMLVVAVAAVQIFVTSPGQITDIELRISLLTGAPALVTTLTARWVDAGRHDR